MPFDAGFNDDGEWFHDSCFATDTRVYLVRTNRENTELVVYPRDQVKYSYPCSRTSL